MSGVTAEQRAELVRALYGYMTSQMIRTAVQLRLPELVAAGPRTVAELANSTGTHPPSLRRLLRALCSVGVLSEPEPGRFGSGALASALVEGNDTTLVSITRLFCSEEFWLSWNRLPHSIETGESAFERLYGSRFFDYLSAEPDLARTFDAAMAENASFEAPRFVHGYDFSRYGRIVDVGGGNGALLCAILRANPGQQGVVFEVPEVAAAAEEQVRRSGLADRCEVVAGDFFDTISCSGDAFLIKSVIHNWDDERCVSLLRNCREALPADGRLLVLEPVLPDRMQAAACLETAMSDLNMLVLTAGGFERSESEFRALFDKSGFEIRTISDRISATDFRVIEAVPA